jgi:hypothetical protein
MKSPILAQALTTKAAKNIIYDPELSKHYKGKILNNITKESILIVSENTESNVTIEQNAKIKITNSNLTGCSFAMSQNVNITSQMISIINQDFSSNLTNEILDKMMHEFNSNTIQINGETETIGSKIDNTDTYTELSNSIIPQSELNAFINEGGITNITIKEEIVNRIENSIVDTKEQILNNEIIIDGETRDCTTSDKDEGEIVQDIVINTVVRDIDSEIGLLPEIQTMIDLLAIGFILKINPDADTMEYNQQILRFIIKNSVDNTIEDIKNGNISIDEDGKINIDSMIDSLTSYIIINLDNDDEDNDLHNEIRAKIEKVILSYDTVQVEHVDNITELTINGEPIKNKLEIDIFENLNIYDEEEEKNDTISTEIIIAIVVSVLLLLGIGIGIGLYVYFKPATSQLSVINTPVISPQPSMPLYPLNL